MKTQEKMYMIIHCKYIAYGWENQFLVLQIKECTAYSFFSILFQTLIQHYRNK